MISGLVQIDKKIGAKGFDDIQEEEVLNLVTSEKTGLTIEEVKEILEETSEKSTKEPMEISEMILFSKHIIKIIKFIEVTVSEALDNDPTETMSLRTKHDREMTVRFY